MERHAYEPNEFHWGEGCTTALPAVLREHGRDRALIVCGQSTAESGIVERVADRLGASHVGTFAGSLAEKSIETVTAGVERKRSVDADLLVSVGGGTATDTAKAISVRDAEDALTFREMRAEFDGRDVHVPELTAEKDPVVAVTTTLSAGEISNAFGVTDVDAGEQFVVLDERIRPKACFYDPELTRTTPKRVLATSGMAAINHAVEILYSDSTAANPFYLATAEKALELLRTHLPTAYRSDDLKAIQDAQLGAAMSGLGATEVCINHGINHVLMARHPVSHGEGNSVLLPHGVRYNYEAVPDRIHRIASALGVDTGADDVLEATIAEIESIRDALDAPGRLRDVGVDRGDFEQLSTLAVDDPMMANNPRTVTVEGVRGILEAAW